MEKITYRKTLDVHRGGTQFLLQGFQTADRLSRVIELSLMASGDTIDFPLERVEAMMYITSPGMEKPSINACIIKDNKVIYEVLPIVVEGITTMQLKLIETSPEGAKSVLASPSFAVEVSKSGTDDAITEENKATFTALETAAANAKMAYDERLTGIELTSDGIFKVTYADGSKYTSDAIKRLSHGDNSVLSESYAKGGTGVRTDEDIDNAKYYYNSAKAEAVKADNIMRTSNDILEEVKLHGQYTAFTMNFDTGNLEYVSPIYTFEVNNETGQLEVKEQNNSFNDEVGAKVQEWLGKRGVVLEDLQQLSDTVEVIGQDVEDHSRNLDELNSGTPIKRGGTGAKTAEDALVNLGVRKELDDINKRIDDMGWITLGSVLYEKTTPEVTLSYDKAEQITIQCDNELLAQMTDFRYVLKSGARFRAYTHCTTQGKSTDAKFYLINANHYLLEISASDSGSYSGSTETVYAPNEDIIFRSVSLATQDGIKVMSDREQNNIVSVKTTSDPISYATLSCGFSIDSDYLSQGISHGTGSIEVAFTLELQGKR